MTKSCLVRFSNAGNNFLLFAAMMGSGTVATKKPTANALKSHALPTMPKNKWA